MRKTGLFATIRKESKYFYEQQPLDLFDDPVPFPVEFDPTDHYCIHGGMGGRYTLFDVQLYFYSDDGWSHKLPMFERPV